MTLNKGDFLTAFTDGFDGVTIDNLTPDQELALCCTCCTAASFEGLDAIEGGLGSFDKLTEVALGVAQAMKAICELRDTLKTPTEQRDEPWAMAIMVQSARLALLGMGDSKASVMAAALAQKAVERAGMSVPGHSSKLSAPILEHVLAGAKALYNDLRGDRVEPKPKPVQDEDDTAGPAIFPPIFPPSEP